MKNNYILFLLLCAFSVSTFAQTPSIKWWYNTNDAAFGNAASADFDNDGKLEVVFGCYRNDSSVHALNAENGTLLWKYNTAPNGFEGCNDVAPIIYDVDGSSTLEVIVPSSCNPKTFCFNGNNGTVKWVCNTKGSDSPPTIADIDGDGKPEILHGEFGGFVICINAEDGTKAWEIAVDSNSWVQTAPTVLDLNGDSILDFVVGTWNFNYNDSIVAFRGDNQTRLWSFAVNDHMYHGTAVADFDLDGKPELVVGSYNDTLYCINGEDGTIDWKYRGTGGFAGTPASIGDIDNDGNCDIVFVNGFKVTALNNNGTFKWDYTIPNGRTAFRGVVLADITNDQYKDVIFGTSNGELTALHGNNGNVIWNMNLRAHYGDNRYEIDHAPLVADFDGDDTLDVFIAGGHAEYPNFFNDFGRAYLISTGSKGNGPDWLMFQRDARRQSSFCSSMLNSIAETSANQEAATVFPNPASNNITISFNESEKAKNITIYNTNGKMVFSQNNVKTNQLNVQLHNWQNGMYFYQIQNSDEKVVSGKFIVQQ